jgi:hypothetical protein
LNKNESDNNIMGENKLKRLRTTMESLSLNGDENVIKLLKDGIECSMEE